MEARVSRENRSVVLQWARDSAYRFYPLLQDDNFGLVLHPFDLATNKVLALIGRLEVRDWVDVIHCDRTLQPLGYLAWAACGKDPGFSPQAILQQAARSTRYSEEEVLSLDFEGSPPDAAELSKAWHRALEEAQKTIALLPPKEAGKCVLSKDDGLFRGGFSELKVAVTEERLHFHPGSIRGTLPTLVR